MCYACLLINNSNLGLPTAKQLVSQVGEIVVPEEHKIEIYQLALDKASELDIDALQYTADLAKEIQLDLLRKS